MSNLTVTTHADGRGTWHAKVTIPQDVAPVVLLSQQGGMAHRAALRAVVAEIDARGQRAPDYRISITREGDSVGKPNGVFDPETHTRTFYFREL